MVAITETTVLDPILMQYLPSNDLQGLEHMAGHQDINPNSGYRDYISR